jgi:hypothetical protein
VTARNIDLGQRSIDEVDMLYFDRRPEPEPAGRFRELTLLCVLAAVAVAITLGAVWLGLDFGEVLPIPPP